MSEEAEGPADERLGKVLKAGRLATFNAWTLAAFGALSLLFAFGSVTALIVGAALLLLAWIEFRGRAALRRLEPGGLRLLGWNQIALFVLLAAYCLRSIHVLRTRPPEQLETAAALAGLPFRALVTLLVVTYVAVIVVSLVVQGLFAAYYWSRGRLLVEHLEETPAPALDRQRRGGSAPGEAPPEA